MKHEKSYRISGKDKAFILFIYVIVGITFFHMQFSESENFWISVLFIGIVFSLTVPATVAVLNLNSGHPRLMKFTFVLAFICNLIGISIQDSTFVGVAFYSVLLYPFLEWLDIPAKIPQNIVSTLFFGMLQIIAVYLISLLIESVVGPLFY